MTPQTFGDYFKACRTRTGKGLHAWCQEHGFTPSYVMDVERGREPPPIAHEPALQQFADALNLQAGSPEWHEFHDHAFAEHGVIPPDLLADAGVVAQLPQLFKALREATRDGYVVQVMESRPAMMPRSTYPGRFIGLGPALFTTHALPPL